MLIYCDRLTLGACIKVIRLSWADVLFRRRSCTVEVLDSIPTHGGSKLLKIFMGWLRLRVNESSFSAGHLMRENGQSVAAAAYEAAIELAFDTARHMVDRSAVLVRLNNEWERNTVFLRIAQTLQIPANRVVLQFMVAKALSVRSEDNTAVLIAQNPVFFDPKRLRELVPDLPVAFYWAPFAQSGGTSYLSPPGHEFLVRMRGGAIILVCLRALRELRARVKSPSRSTSNPPEASESKAGRLLMFQEDDLSLDRSYRTQPHWLFAEDGKPPFETIVVLNSGLFHVRDDAENLREWGIFPIYPPKRNILSLSFWSLHPLQRRLRRGFLSCLFWSVFGRRGEYAIMSSVADMLCTATGLVPFCTRYRVQTFLTSENYNLNSGAMTLIGPAMGITAVSYQFSNMGNVGPLMMTTGDVMLTFSPRYHQLWASHGVEPGKSVDTGYVYDASFVYIRSRSDAVRTKFSVAGARFIICYYDENVMNDKYAITNDEDHCEDVSALLDLVLRDPSIGLVMKPQFQKNLPQRFPRIAQAREAALCTGRYIELTYGTHRNIILPVEAALASDITIGHAVGATASLEAAVAGVRCVLLNPYGMRSKHDELYAKADIVYRSMSAVLDAISGFREGVPTRSRLGDWSSIISEFDPFRDGCAGHRVRRLMEENVMRKVSL